MDYITYNLFLEKIPESGIVDIIFDYNKLFYHIEKNKKINNEIKKIKHIINDLNVFYVFKSNFISIKKYKDYKVDYYYRGSMLIVERTYFRNMFRFPSKPKELIIIYETYVNVCNLNHKKIHNAYKYSKKIKKLNDKKYLNNFI